jgi:hypothetical protein
MALSKVHCGIPVVSLGKSDFNNHKAITAVRNLTIEGVRYEHAIDSAGVS